MACPQNGDLGDRREVPHPRRCRPGRDQERGLGEADVGRDALHGRVVEIGGVQDDPGRVAAGRIAGKCGVAQDLHRRTTSPDPHSPGATQHEVGGGHHQIGLGELNVVVATGRQDVRRPGHQGDEAVLSLFVDGVGSSAGSPGTDVSPPNGSVLVSTTTGTCGKAGGARACAALASRSTRSDSGVRIDAIGIWTHRQVEQLVPVDRPAVAEGRGNGRAEGIDEHHAGDLVRVGLRVELHHQPAERMADQHVRLRHRGRGEHLMQFRDDVGGRPRLGHRCAAVGQRGALDVPHRARPVVRAHPTRCGQGFLHRGCDGAADRAQHVGLVPDVRRVVVPRHQDDRRPAGHGGAAAIEVDLPPADVDRPGGVGCGCGDAGRSRVRGRCSDGGRPR